MTIRDAPSSSAHNTGLKKFIACDVSGCSEQSVMSRTAERIWVEVLLTDRHKRSHTRHICPKHAASAVDEGVALRVMVTVHEAVTVPPNLVPPLSMAEAMDESLKGIVEPAQVRGKYLKKRRLLDAEEVKRAERMAESPTDTDALDI